MKFKKFLLLLFLPLVFLVGCKNNTIDDISKDQYMDWILPKQIKNY